MKVIRHMSAQKPKPRLARLTVYIVLLLFILISPLSVVIPHLSTYTSPYYSETLYKDLERVFNSSQYRQKNNPAIIPDETLFSYAAGAYLRGMDPILANSEITPLGKYFLAASIYLFRNDRTVILLFAFLSGVSIWLVAKHAIADALWALVPLLFVSLDRLFINQLAAVPLLDIIQLPFIYFTIAAFFRERRLNRFPFTAICIGCVMATKTVVPGILLIGSIGLFLLLKKEIKTLMYFVAWLPVAALIFVLTYTRTFVSGYTFWEFLKFQKWIFLYQKSKLIYPFSSLRLLLFNQWQTWWGSFAVVAANDWSFLWPVSTIASLGAGVWMMLRRHWEQTIYEPILLLLLWVLIYQLFLSLGVVSSRFFIPLLPAQYILLTYVVRSFFQAKLRGKLLFLFLCLGAFVWVKPAYADYVLPYPSFMPGNKVYILSRLIDRATRVWSFGSIGSFKYHLKLADKYLVEAKTLFEYNQYLLAADALKRSDVEFSQIPKDLGDGLREGKDMSRFRTIAREASVKHKSILTTLRSVLPTRIEWRPEKMSPTTIPVAKLLDEAVAIRENAARVTQ